MRPYLFLFGLVLAGCGQNMIDQPKLEPYEASRFFPDGRASRPRIEGTVARGELRADAHLYTGMVNGLPAETFPFAVTSPRLARGRERFEIFCAVCHDRLGTGRGTVVRRGFKPPPSFHEERLRRAPAGHFFDVISRGFGSMPDYAAQISPWDRWAIVAYIRALQLSQHAPAAELTAADRGRLEQA